VRRPHWGSSIEGGLRPRPPFRWNISPRMEERVASLKHLMQFLVVLVSFLSLYPHIFKKELYSSAFCFPFRGILFCTPTLVPLRPEIPTWLDAPLLPPPISPLGKLITGTMFFWTFPFYLPLRARWIPPPKAQRHRLRDSRIFAFFFTRTLSLAAIFTFSLPDGTYSQYRF